MTPADVIVEVRKLIQDTLAPYRYSDTDLLGYVNQVLKRVALFRPDLFGSITTVSTTADTPIQTLQFDSLIFSRLWVGTQLQKLTGRH